MLNTTTPANVFLIHVARHANISPEVFEQKLAAITKRFVVPAVPHIASAMWGHRLMRNGQGEYVWEIMLDDLDGADEDAATNEPLEAAVRHDVEQEIALIGSIQSFSAFTHLPMGGPYVDVPVQTPDDSGFLSFGSDDAPWYDHATDSGTPNAGKAIPNAIANHIQEYRHAVPSEPNLKPYGKGHVYFALEDKAHRGWLASYFDAKSAGANAADRRKIRAFEAFQTREGTTASINTYDNQIVTWGTGWGGLGWLGSVMTRATANNAVRAALEQAGVRYRSRNTYDIVDLQTNRVITGKKDALEIMRAALPLLNLLIQLARSSDTREAVADAQLGTFLISAGDISSAHEMATQALFNMVSHLKHWAPGYATGCLEWAVPQVADQPISVERDKRLAVLVGRYFYGKARGKSWIPDWKQFQGYWRHMKDDGLDCLSDPFIQASTYPKEDPFATNQVQTQSPTPLQTQTQSTQRLTPQTTTPEPTISQTTQSTASTPKPRILRSALLSGIDQLESIAQGHGLLRRGATGDGVLAIQQLLLNLGYPLATGANGIFEEPMFQAVQSFQRSRHLTADGIIGRQTITQLDAAAGSNENQ